VHDEKAGGRCGQSQREVAHDIDRRQHASPLGELFVEPGFRGCAFVNASAESRPGGAVEAVSDESRAWTRSLFADLAESARAVDPQGLARQLVLLCDGAMVSARMDRNPGSAAAARTVAASLIDAAIVAE
jgi:hypothetical protein